MYVISQFFFSSQCKHDLLQSLSYLPNIVWIGCINYHPSLLRQHPVLMFFIALLTIFTIGLLIPHSTSSRHVLPNDTFSAPRTSTNKQIIL